MEDNEEDEDDDNYPMFPEECGDTTRKRVNSGARILNSVAHPARTAGAPQNRRHKKNL